MPRLDGGDAVSATPLDDEDLDGLIPTFIATRADVNRAEQANIEAATRWAFRGRRVGSVTALLSAKFASAVHRRMFGDVWRWAGQTRTRVTNIGVEPFRIVNDTALLFDDAKFWHEHGTYDAPETAVRVHHRLVHVHPYRNGNGRHARFMADLYLHLVQQPRLPWGGGRLDEDGDVRRAYLAALRTADRGDLGPLVAFARSST